MFVKNERGQDLMLTATRLTQLEKNESHPYYINLKEWRLNPNTFKVYRADGSYSFHPGHEGGLSIGCEHFTEKEYAKITQAADAAARKKPVRKTKRKPAKTAKARK